MQWGKTMVYGLTAEPRHFALPVCPTGGGDDKNPQKTALVFGSENRGIIE